MHKLLVRSILFITFLFITSTTAWAQIMDTTAVFVVDSGCIFELNAQYTKVNIINSNSDSTKIHALVNVSRVNTSSPFLGVKMNFKKQSEQLITSEILFESDFVNNNEFEAQCTIAIPKGTNLKVNSRYGTINISGSLESITADLDYINFNAEFLYNTNLLDIDANYSSLNIGGKHTAFTFKGSNNNLNIDNIRELITQTEYSIIKIGLCESFQTHTYSDRLEIKHSKTTLINGKKSSCHIGTILDLLQCEISEGELIVDNIKPWFNEINISNAHTKSALTFEPECQFTFNTNMRYSELHQTGLTLKEITFPNGRQHSGIYGNNTSATSRVSIISNYGDVTIAFK